MENKTRNIIDSVESLEKALKKLRAALLSRTGR